jgi:hypothetical protein
MSGLRHDSAYFRSRVEEYAGKPGKEGIYADELRDLGLALIREGDEREGFVWIERCVSFAKSMWGGQNLHAARTYEILSDFYAYERHEFSTALGYLSRAVSTAPPGEDHMRLQEDYERAYQNVHGRASL